MRGLAGAALVVVGPRPSGQGVVARAAVELNMLQRLLDTVQLTGAQWALVLALSLVAPAFTAIDKAIQLRRLNRSLHDE